MAKPELPLAELKGSFFRLVRGKGGFCHATMRLDPEDMAQFNSYIDGPQGEKLILIKLFPLPFDYKAGPVDANQGQAEEDSQARLLKAWDAYVDYMTTDVPAESD